MRYPKMQWKRGQRAEIARRAGISKQHLTNILKRRKNARPSVAVRLEQASAEVGQYIPRTEWAFATTSEHPLFR